MLILYHIYRSFTQEHYHIITKLQEVTGLDHQIKIMKINENRVQDKSLRYTTNNGIDLITLTTFFNFCLQKRQSSNQQRAKRLTSYALKLSNSENLHILILLIFICRFSYFTHYVRGSMGGDPQNHNSS